MNPDLASGRKYSRALDIAAYVTWLAISIDVLRTAVHFAPQGPIPALYAAAAFLLLYVFGFFFATRPRSVERRWPDYWPHLVMLAALFALLSIGPLGTAPVLTVVVAVLAVLTMPLRHAIALLIGVNLALGGVFAFIWHRPSALQALMIYAGFQLFAAVAAHAMRRAQTSASELREVNANLLATQSLLAESARESERLRLSRELHDVSGHKLTALKINLSVLSRDAGLAERREFQTVRTLADELLEDLRGVVSQLRRHEGMDIRNAFERLAELLPSPRVHVEVAEDARAENAERAAALLRLAQEALTNSAKHAGSRNVWLKLTRDSDGLQLLIEDDGSVREPLRAGHGVQGMRERVAELGGQLEIGSAAAGGLRLCFRLPRESAA
jgi:signal transduction histidine kinase